MPLRVAIFPWGDVVEMFLDPLKLSFRQFAEEMTGGWLFGYVAALASVGAEAIIVCPSDQVREDTVLTHRQTGVPMCFVPGRRRTVRDTDVASLLRWFDEPARCYRRALMRFGCNRILCQEYEYARFDRLVVLGRTLKIPVYASFQGGDRTASRVEAYARPRSLRAAAGLIVASRHERERLARAYRDLETPIAAIPNPLDASRWQAENRQSARAELGLPTDRFIIVCHGRIDIYRKGLDVLLAAWQIGMANRSNAELVLIGSGQDHVAFTTLLSTAGISNVRWLSHYTIDSNALRLWLSAADAYVSASRIEGMPVAPLEAMACRLPVIATDAQGVLDIFGDGESSGGIVVRRECPADLALAFDRLADDPALRHRLGEAGQHRVETAFGLTAVGTALVEFLGGEAGSR